MKLKKMRQSNIPYLLGLIYLFNLPSVNSAEQISFVSGIFNRTIPIEYLDHLAKTGETKGSLENIISLSNQDPEKLASLLNQSVDLPLVTTSKLMYSKIGDVIIKRVAKIIYPIRIHDISITVPAIRAGVTNGIVVGNGKLTLIQFLKSYPNKIMAINMPALNQVIDKVDSMSDLVKFFSDSPLEKLQKGSAED